MSAQLCPHGGRNKDRFSATGDGGTFEACAVHLAQAVRAAGGGTHTVKVKPL